MVGIYKVKFEVTQRFEKSRKHLIDYDDEATVCATDGEAAISKVKKKKLGSVEKYINDDGITTTKRIVITKFVVISVDRTATIDF